MHSFAAATALMGLSTLASAAPWMAPSYASTSSAPTSTSTSTGEVDFTFPLANGFPNLTATSPATLELEQTAQGTIPVAPLANATTVAPADLEDVFLSLGFIAFNELFEVAFFNELVANVTAGASGFDDIPNKDYVLKTLNVILAQEELHELNANLAFNKKTNGTILPCEYDFPVSTFNESIALASTFTDVVLGTLPDIQTIFGEADQSGLIRGVGAVIGQEGEQNGFYRQILGKVPSALPFLTGSARDFAFSAINQGFVVPGSCQNIEALLVPGHALSIFNTLQVDTMDITSAVNSTISFSAIPFDGTTDSKKYTMPSDFDGLYVTYINQQNAPLSVPIDYHEITFNTETNVAQFTASFPGQSKEMNGLSIAALTTGSNFADPDAVAAATAFGPALIEIN